MSCLNYKNYLFNTLLLIFLMAGNLVTAKAEEIYPVAVLDFQDKSPSLKGTGQKINDVLFANMSANTDLYMVDRSHLKQLLEEASLNLSGLVNQSQAMQIGQLTGARILVSGSVFEIDGTLMITAKIIGTETSRVVGVSVKAQTSDNLFKLAEELSNKVIEKIEQNKDNLCIRKKTREDEIKSIRDLVKGSYRPRVVVDIGERHIGNIIQDPAAETEFEHLLTELGFPVIAKKDENSKAVDFRIIGKGFSEYAARHGDIISVRARLEVKAINAKTGQVLFADRQTVVEVDLTEHIAGKKALQRAAARIASRLIPKLATAE